MPQSSLSEEKAQAHETTQQESTATNDAKPPPAKKSALSFLFSDNGDVQIVKVKQPASREVRVEREIQTYREMQKLKMDDDPLKFWQTNSDKYPHLFQLAKQYLCVQAKSVASERVFSTADDTVTATRSCLDSEHIDRLIFLKKNFDKDQDLPLILQKM